MSKRKKRKKGQSGGKKLSEEDNQLCWDIANSMLEQNRFPRKDYNRKVYCKDCKRKYCLGFNGTDAYCDKCYCNSYCQKETDGGRICQQCWR